MRGIILVWVDGRLWRGLGATPPPRPKVTLVWAGGPWRGLGVLSPTKDNPYVGEWPPLAEAWGGHPPHKDNPCVRGWQPLAGAWGGAALPTVIHARAGCPPWGYDGSGDGRA